MISYDKVIRKRLRFKGDPVFVPTKQVHFADGVAPAVRRDAREADPEDEVRPVVRVKGVAREEAPVAAFEVGRTEEDGDVGGVVHGGAEEDERDSAERLGENGQTERDGRTDAERRFADKARLREKDRLRKVAAVPYREQLDVGCVLLLLGFGFMLRFGLARVWVALGAPGALTWTLVLCLRLYLQQFNDKLSKEPDHYDIFRTSFTK